MSDKKAERIFIPTILKTKEELVKALEDSKIKVTKYHILNHEEKQFVQLIAFGGYNPSQAIRVIHPEYADPWATGKRWAAREDVAEVLEELTYKRDKYWMNKVSGSADKALRTLEYIMATTEDDSLKAAVAKTIVELAHKNETLRKKTDDVIGGFRMVINVPAGSVPYNPDDVIDISPEDENADGKSMILNYAKTSEENYEID